MSEFTVQPHDRGAEQVVLGIMLDSPVGTERARRLLAVRDFYEPHHVVVFSTLVEMAESGEPTDVRALASRLTLTGQLSRAGDLAYLIDLHSSPQPLSVLDWYARQLVDLADRRDLLTAAGRAHQRAAEANGLSAAELRALAREDLDRVGRDTDDDLSSRITVETLLGEPPGYEWLIPRLLERGDRLILTGGEGAGKSTLGRQLAVTTAAGLHPFSMVPQEPRRVMVVDCENGHRLSMRRYRPLLLAAGSEHVEVAPENFWLESRPRGLDLAHREGLSWLLQRAEHFKPDLLVIGPLYRLHSGDPSDERDARAVAAALDRVREATGAALIVEAHSPHRAPGTAARTLRPVGSSLWLRWPEFGYGIRYAEVDHAVQFRVMDVEAWRGPRDERSWPKRIRSGGTTSPWPWVVEE